jgi:hypothetical protein
MGQKARKSKGLETPRSLHLLLVLITARRLLVPMLLIYSTQLMLRVLTVATRLFFPRGRRLTQLLVVQEVIPSISLRLLRLLRRLVPRLPELKLSTRLVMLALRWTLVRSLI